MPMKEKLKESDLYSPVKALLESMGYTVKGEVLDCDVMGVKKNTVVIVELKLLFNMKVLLQAVERKKTTDSVYIAIPHTCSVYTKDSKSITLMLKQLGLGLLIITTGTQKKALPILDPEPYTPKKNHKLRTALLKEFEALKGDPNIGGTKGEKMTAYRQDALDILQHLNENGPHKASNIKDLLGIARARAILYDNHYGWFEPLGKGIYGVTPQGALGLDQWKNYLL